MTSEAPQVQRLDRALLIQGPAALALTAHLLQQGAARVRDVDGTVLPGTAELIRAAREAAGMSQATSRPRDDDRKPTLESLEGIDAREAAGMLGVTVRHVQRLAASLGAQWDGRTLVYDRGAVEAYAAHRAEGANR